MLLVNTQLGLAQSSSDESPSVVATEDDVSTQTKAETPSPKDTSVAAPKAGDGNFKPSEEIIEDQPVPFPVDI
ncbi:MAG: hypothetical protein AAF197_02415 [Pseudomonadota bacterium]